jgi:predicted amidohydrolase YtcJ
MSPVIFFFACTEPADVVFRGDIWTGSAWVDALAVDDGVVTALGDDVGEGLVEVTLDGPAYPGFLDAHTHTLAGSFAMDRLLLLGTPSMEAMVRSVDEYAAETPDEPWIVGYGWLAESVGQPDGRLIDAVVSDRPVLLVDNSGHSAVVNSAALELVGITADTPDPEGGVIGRDEDGNPTGFLHEAALSLVSDRALEDYDDALLASALDETLDDFAKSGLTGVTEILAVPGFDIGRPWIYTERDVPLRVVVYLPIFEAADVAEAAAMRGTFENERVRFGGGKIWVDGSMGSASAWVSEPYEDSSDDYGSHYFDTDALVDILREAEAHNLHLKLHANGDAAVTATLDAMEQVLAENGSLQRHTLEHAVLLGEGDLERIVALDLPISVQPSHYLASSLGSTADLLGDRFAQCYDHRGLMDAGVTLAMGTDWPVWPEPSPLLSSWTAGNRDPGGLSPEEALWAYTEGAALSMGQTDLGRLDVGYMADLVVLDGRLDEDELNEIRVLDTFVGGI